MYAIKARFDGQKITPEEPVPVNKPYEAIVTFTEPEKQAEKPKKTLLDFAGILDEDTFNEIMDGIRRKREPEKKPKKSFLDGLEHGPILDDETFKIIMDGIREKREPYGRYSDDIF